MGGNGTPPLVQTAHARPGQGKHRVFALSLGLPQARQWIVNKVVEVLDREKIDWFLTDTMLGGHLNPEKHKLTADQNDLAITGFEKAMEDIHALCPQVLIEHCDVGLSLLNYKMTAQHVTSITCDNAQALDTGKSYEASGRKIMREAIALALDAYRQADR